jgi:outer membrane protein OmpA-like peptidoglycan-associated protein
MSRPRLASSLFVLGLGLLHTGCTVQAAAHASVGVDDVRLGAGVSAEVIRLHVEGDELVHEGGEINFAYDAAELEGERTFATLEAYAELLHTYPEVHLRIEGHTDSRGPDARNRSLSQRRAEAVRDWLMDHGVAPERLVAQGFGEDRPKIEEPLLCYNRKAEDAPPWCEGEIWSYNRRSEFHVIEGAETLPTGELTTTETRAERPPAAEASRPPGFDSGAYVYLSPGLLSATLGDRDEVLARQLSYRWGAGAGYLWRRERFAAAFGLGLSHVPVVIDGGSPRCALIQCVSAHDLLLDAELRIGGGSRRLLGYVLFAPGLALGASQVGSARITTAGFGLDFGVGLWGLIWRGLFVGGEALVNPIVYAHNAPAFHSGTTAVGLGLRALAGWQFGGRHR